MAKQKKTKQKVKPEPTDDISTYLTRVIQARCDGCKTRETLSTDNLNAAVTVFRRRGWSARGTMLLCKECVDD